MSICKKKIIFFVNTIFVLVLIIGAFSCDARRVATEEKIISVVHTVSYSNAVVFKTINAFPKKIERKFVPDPAKHMESLIAESKKQPAISVTPFANALIAASRNKDLRIIAGSGLNGISLVSRDSPNILDLKGKRIGTSKGDSLEIFVVELLDKNGILSNEYELVYFTDPFEAIEAIKNSRIDAVTHVEPFATDLISQHHMHRVTRSYDLWGNHPDSVIMCLKSTINEHPSSLKWLIEELKKTERNIEAEPQKAAIELAKTFYDMPSDTLLSILKFQKPEIDIRSFEKFFENRSKTLVKLRYIDNGIDPKIFNWTFLK